MNEVSYWRGIVSESLAELRHRKTGAILSWFLVTGIVTALYVHAGDNNDTVEWLTGVAYGTVAVVALWLLRTIFYVPAAESRRQGASIANLEKARREMEEALNRPPLVSVTMDDDFCRQISSTDNEHHGTYRVKITNAGRNKVDSVRVKVSGDLFEVNGGQKISSAELYEDTSLAKREPITESPLDIGDPVYFRLGSFQLRYKDGADGKIRGSLASSPSAGFVPSNELQFLLTVVPAGCQPIKVSFFLSGAAWGFKDNLH